MGNVPVLDSNVRNRKLGIRPALDLAVGNLALQSRISVDGLLFDVTNETMEEARGDPTGDEANVEEDALGTDKDQPQQPTGLGQVHPCEEMHSFVGGFLKKCLDPALVTGSSSEGA